MSALTHKINLFASATLLLMQITTLCAQARSKTLLNTELTKKLDYTVNKALEQNQIVGLELIVKHDKKILYHKACGYLDKEKALLMPVNAIYRFASMSKAITIATALSLAESGVFKMSDPTSKFLPFFNPKTKDGKVAEITLEHLASHTAGLDYPFIENPDGPYHQANIADGLMEDSVSQDENLRKLAELPLLFEPGKGFRYSISIDVLGKIIEVATGKSLNDAIQERIGKPLKMRDLTFTVEKAKLDRLTIPYCNTASGTKLMGKNQFVAFGGSGFVFAPQRATDKKAFQSGGSGLCGTATDYLRFIEFMNKNKEMNSVRSKGYPVSFGEGFEFGYCGAILTDPFLAKTPQNKGTRTWGGAYGHTWFFDPIEKITVVCMTNTTPYALQGAFPDSIRDIVYNCLSKNSKNNEVQK